MSQKYGLNFHTYHAKIFVSAFYVHVRIAVCLLRIHPFFIKITILKEVEIDFMM